MVRQYTKNYTTLLRHPNPMCNQGDADNNSSREADHED